MDARILIIVLFAASLSGCSGGSDAPPAVECDAPGFVDGKSYVNVTTNRTSFVVELWGDKAPITVCNFLTYVDEKFYDDTIFHRVIKGFMVQGGGFDRQGREKDTHDPIVLETAAKLHNEEKTLAMARTNDPDSATSQFFVNVAKNDFLDPDGSRPPGYAVFGKVVQGWETVKTLESTPVTRGPSGEESTPTREIRIVTARLTTAP